MTRRALLKSEVEQELANGAVLILVRGWYYLIDDEGRSRKLDEWKAQAWTGDRAFAGLRTNPWRLTK